MNSHNSFNNSQLEKSEKNVEEEHHKKLTTPEIYPNNRMSNSKIPIASDENVEYARKWIESNRL